MTKIPDSSYLEKGKKADQSSFRTVGRTCEKSTREAEKSNPIALIDWLEIRCTVNPTSFLKSITEAGIHRSGSLALQVRDYGTKFFELFAAVFHCGEKAAEIHWGDRIGKTQDCVLKLDNTLFYRVQDLAGYLRQLLQDLDLNFGGHVTRLDLALDGVELGGLWADYFGGKLIKKGRGEVAARFDQNAGEWRSARFGNRSYKYCRYYNKTAEIAKKSAKQYISDFHRANGLTGEVKRLEIELHWAYLKTLDGFDLWDILEDGESIFTLWKTATKNWLEFAEKTGDSNRSRAKVVWTIEKILGNVRTVFRRIYAKVADGVHSAKIALKSMYRTGSKRGGRMVRTAMAAMLGEYKLYEWMETRLDKWAAQMENEAVLKGMTLDADFLENPFGR